MSRLMVSRTDYPPGALRAAARVAAIVTTLCTLAHAAAAQAAPPLATGARVRVVQLGADGRPEVFVSGTLSSLRGDTVRLAIDGIRGNAEVYVLNDRRRLEMAGEVRRHVGRWVVRGTLIGAVGLGVLAAASFEPCHSTEFMNTSCMFAPHTAVEAGVMGAALGAVGGALAGLVVGVFVRDVTWVPARTAGVRIALAPGGAGVSVAF